MQVKATSTAILLIILILGLALAIKTTTAKTPSHEIILSQNRSGFHSSSMEYPRIINVSDYEGDSDTERIQKALDDVPSEGATVFIPKGIWTASNLTARSRTIILGVNGTIIERPENTTEPFIKFENQVNFAVYNITIDGKDTPEATGMLVTNSTLFEIADSTFINISKNAIRVSGLCEHFTIRDNMFIECNVVSILLYGSPGERYIQNFEILNNFLMNGTNNGKIGVAYAANGTIENNTIMNCEFGIATRCISHIIITNNHIENCISYAIYLATLIGTLRDPGSDNIEIIGNYAANCNIGISRFYGTAPISNVTVENNEIIYNEQWDILADFPANFINNTITSSEKLKILETSVKFIGNVGIHGQPVIPGDINTDSRIDMKDIGCVARLFGSSPSSDGWNQLADIIGDEIIDMKDISFVAKKFGFECT